MTDTAIDDEAPAPARRRPIGLIAALVVAALLALGLWLAYRPAPDQIQGMADAREMRITSKVTGRIAAFHVEEGQAVKAGQLLYTLDSPEVAAKSEQAGGALAAAQAVESKADEGARPEDIRAAEAQWRRAQAAADLAQTTSARTQRLYQQGVIAGQKADEARTNAVAAAEQAKAARAQYDLALAGARRQDKAAASGQVQQARGAVAEVKAAAAETRVLAPADGEVGKRLAQPGELVPQGFPVFRASRCSCSPTPRIHG
ncbi:biotin/lipoyl-binding protein [Sphingomonas sp.]|uniref:HlyD family secretion protein n=1 Tax=Sphingomonas sp. TaxID=28214 RepID=UPI0025F01255|nr:biotin/lipoyl-binding protein [Sphingomonas sp.]